VFFITGNHDYFSGVESWAEFVRGLGITVLRNQHVRIDAGSTGFDLAGVDDDNGGRMAGQPGYDIVAALAGRDERRPVVLMAHDPLTFPVAAKHGVDLQISGHTHGGQMWPFMYAVRLITPYVAGLHQRGASQIYVSRGTGFWGPCMRLCAPAEITELMLQRACIAETVEVEDPVPLPPVTAQAPA
jgi:predicted MPP superfamily phosphohydrolase